MAKPITLTIAQARSLQTIPKEDWPGELRFLLHITTPDTPDGILDKPRVDAAFKLMDLQWQDKQIALQLCWHSKAISQVRAMWKYQRENPS